MLKEHSQIIEFSCVVFVATTVVVVAWVCSEAIPVIDSGKSFVPQPVDYLRTFVLASLSSFAVNYLYKAVDKTFIFCKVWIEFLALLLLAYPQKTEQQYTYSSWNLVEREGYLFGVFYTLMYLVFYIFDLWQVEMNDNELNKYVRVGEDPEASISEEVRKKSTLTNCINVRRHSTSTTYGSVITSVMSRGSVPPLAVGHQVDVRWVLENSLWIALTMMHEIGLALLLSITFIYVPELDDSYFTDLEIYFYNKINLFSMEIVFPLFILSSLIQILLHSVSEDQEQKTRTFVAYSVVSVGLFILGCYLT
ncbi:hypothetical protein BON22_4165 [Cyberlindnera fabianii]|uniref:Uncharacterized protein n=1 Tax=Cyberlindnera fabianii TaxID=36022 RepID=A0A1V2L1X1_CYBFA|nr:hypothetical protein BON22_4165 [Cyberlindnera fabianii]